jgi:hypothetical protein
MRLLLTVTLAVSLVGGSGRPARADVDLWPLLEISKESTTVLYPFYVREGKFLMIFPWYYRTNEGRDHHVLWPIFKYSDDRVSRIAPIWFRGQNTFTLFPIIHRTPDYTLWSIPPAYLRRDGRFHAVFPLYARSEHRLLLFPSYYRSREPGEPRSDTLWPLLSWVRGAGTSRFDLWAWDSGDPRKWWSSLNLLGRQKGPDHSNTWLLPLFMDVSETTPRSRFMLMTFLFGRHRWPDGSDRWLLPFFFDRRKGQERSTFLMPYYQRIEPDRTTRVLFPVFASHRGPDRRLLYLVLYYWERAPDYSETTFFPVWLKSHGTRRAHGPPGSTRSYSSILWPIYSREEHRSPEGELLERYRRFLIFSDRLDVNEKARTFSILGIPILERM